MVFEAHYTSHPLLDADIVQQAECLGVEFQTDAMASSAALLADAICCGKQ